MSIAAASLTIEQLADDIRREHDRRHGFERLLAATDRVLWRLEELNRDGVERISVEAWGRMYGTLAELPESCREVIADPPDVQKLLDSIFEVQDRLFRWRDPGREAETEPDYVPADLVRWAEVCRWLEGFEQGLPRSLAPQERFADLEALHAHRVVFIQDNTRWRAYSNWPARLERLRVRLEVDV